MNIAFFVRHFSERGTEVAIYDYAKYNEDLLHNKSIIVHMPDNEITTLPTKIKSYHKFKSRFLIVEIKDIAEMANVIQQYNLSFFYTLTHGGGNDCYQFENKHIWGNCKTIKHCVFNTTYPESNFYISISQTLNYRFRTNLPVIPHIVELPDCNTDLRSELNIPKDAIVLGRYGGKDQFDIPFTHEAIVEYVHTDPNMYFLFMNTDVFYQHPQIIYVDPQVNMEYKVQFINTCDAMIHARGMGETFGLSIAEFSMKNKPIITCPCGDLEHIAILNDKSVQYTSKKELLYIFKNIKEIIMLKEDWNAYRTFSPQYVMNLFQTYIFNV